MRRAQIISEYGRISLYLLLLAYFLVFNTQAVADGVMPVTARNIRTNTSNFGTNLSALDTNVQKALDTIDDLVLGGGGAVAGADTQVQFNDGGVMGADADFTYDKTNSLLTLWDTGHTGYIYFRHDGAGAIFGSSLGDFDFYTAGDIRLGILDNDTTFFGAAKDASIEFDGDSLNIVANAVTATDDLNLTMADLYLTLGDNAGGNRFYINDSDGSQVFSVNSNGVATFGPVANDYTMPTARGNAGDVLSDNGAGAVSFVDLSTLETDPNVDSSAEIQAIIGAGVYEPAGITESDISDLQAYLLTEVDPVYAAWYNSGSPTLSNLYFTGDYPLMANSAAGNDKTLGFYGGATYQGGAYGIFYGKNHSTQPGQGNIIVANTNANNFNVLAFDFNSTWYDLLNINGQTKQITTYGTIQLANDEMIENATNGKIRMLSAGGSNNEDLYFDFETNANAITLSSSTLATNIFGLDSYSLGAAGVKMTGDGDGAITFLGLGNGSDENLIINLDDTADIIDLSSSTGAYMRMNFSNVMADAMALYLGTGLDAAMSYTGNGAQDDLLYLISKKSGAGDSAAVWIARDLVPSGMTAVNDYLSPTLVMVNDEGADASDFSAVQIGARTTALCTGVHYFDFYAMTGASDGSVNAATTETAPVFRMGNAGTATTGHGLTAGGLLLENALEVNGAAYFDANVYTDHIGESTGAHGVTIDNTLTVTNNPLFAGTQPKLLTSITGYALTVKVSGGPTPKIYSGTNFDYPVMEFTNAADKTAYWYVSVPNNRTGTTSEIRYAWIAEAGDVLDGVSMFFDTGCFNDAEAFDTGALGGTEIEIEDALQGSGKIQWSDWTSITDDFTAGQLGVVKITRDVDGHSGTDLAQPLGILMVEMRFPVSALGVN